MFDLTKLVPGAVIEGNLDLSNTSITALPDNLTVGGWLDLRNTAIAVLPDNLTVGGWLYLSGTSITVEGRAKYALHDGTYVPGRYLYADGILTHIINCHSAGDYTVYTGKIKGRNVVSVTVGDVTLYAHCNKIRDGIADLQFKLMKNRGTEQYRELTLSSTLSFDDARAMYRIITGACSAGTQQFIDGLREVKDEYSVAEMLEMTKGSYGHAVFAGFFGGVE